MDSPIPDDEHSPHHRKHVVVIGAGFAGLSALKELCKDTLLHLVLISDVARFTYTPSLWEIDAFPALEEDIVIDQRNYCHNHHVEFIPTKS